MRILVIVSAMQSLGFAFCVSLFLASINVVISSSSPKKESTKQRAVFVFGDSLYDPGNNDFLNISIDLKADYPPYGETFFKYPTGRCSDGRLISDFIALHVNLSVWKPYLEPGKQQFINGANFASAGAGALARTNPSTLNLERQLSLFMNVVNTLTQQLGNAEAKKLLTNAVYLFSIGGVDYAWFKVDYPNATESMKLEYVNWVIGNITNVIKEIYKVGGRRFAFQNIGPLGCLPEVRQDYNLSGIQCLEETLALATLHNNALSNVCRKLESQLSGFKYLIFDYYNSLLDRIKNFSKYGFKEGYKACCGSGLYHGINCGIGEYYLCTNPNDYLFWDGYHPTEHAYSQLEKLFWSGNPNVTWPLSMKQLFEFDEPEIGNLADDDLFMHA
ncbi:GDSL esterase/lipase 1-like isoform X4 [Mangifera indica]|uniref:GDSL esterase/lipase 1-like isoform X4 n=1 Tax=Mangifera indica TaxID=29780 RepID=UPI001CFBDEAD|nr:GDSL esterase/lipase 1-like isoform X4 [Mangifera indica]